MAAGRQRRDSPAQPVRMSALLGLQRVDLFRGLGSYTLREIAAQCKWTRCKRNQYVIRRDGADRDVYFVIAGAVRLAASAGRGRRIIFRDVPAGEVFGEHSAIDGRARFADVLALRETLLASMSPEAFRAILANQASVRERLLRRLTGSVRELAERLLDLGARPVQRRIWGELLRLARVAGVDANHARLDPAPTHNDIASRVGSSREQVTRELSRLARQGLLERAGRILLLCDVAVLEELAGDARCEADGGPAVPGDEARTFAGVLSPRAPADSAGDDPLERLSAREMEVLKLVVEGNTSDQMARLLGLSPKSIDTCRSRLMTKLSLEHLPALVKFAIRRGLTSV